MDIEAVKQLQHEMNETTKKTVADFEKRTGTFVNDVRLNRICAIGEHCAPEVNTTVGLAPTY
jgi:hypothetical protein